MEEAFTYGMTALNIMVIGWRTRSMDVVSMNGLMVVNMMVNGKTITCTVEAFTPGKMVDVMRGSTLMTESMDKESTLGRMADNMLESGKMESNMVRVPTDKRIPKKKEGFGKMEKESSG